MRILSQGSSQSPQKSFVQSSKINKYFEASAFGFAALTRQIKSFFDSFGNLGQFKASTCLTTKNLKNYNINQFALDFKD